MNPFCRFGVAGNPPNFWRSAFSNERSNAPQWLHEIGLDALEIQCTYGVRMPDYRIQAFRKNAQEFGIELSIHGPYYISLGTSIPEKLENSLNELRKSVELAKKIGSSRVIFHLGGVEGERKKSLHNAIATLTRFEFENDIGDVKLYPEIEGKVNKLGSLEEILAICSSIKCAWPCLDLAHLHARTNGSLKAKDNFALIINTVEATLGAEALEHLHVHLYPIEWQENVGEISHKAFFDKPPQLSLLERENHPNNHYLPRYEPFLDLLVERQVSSTIICEAKDSQELGAQEMKSYYNAILKEAL